MSIKGFLLERSAAIRRRDQNVAINPVAGAHSSQLAKLAPSASVKYQDISRAKYLDISHAKYITAA
ncbi:hypothetical protein [Bradyrhizobium sp. B120]|uniref:hypothetical protein n=1 Tax=Bradyrhizobium sp. B120 TaxID=3410088 RepID=UPI003B9864EF